ncbi:(E)-4-hydroxy-3-methylbut-2-enyl-diphosphate synthase [uncultured Rikenella sp.]|uniref:(E)-4-hydroxy-3-methylbut-2-enyl-diphosphate synthase n=1 Tax=uncultured Rikenella sp. TaxID=368003 RepID=UPI002639EE8D|nr:(E)-4-hydroxy-3-methylbut-2-enyl-diphosphate synthase [uncultured Rikenella sp.]
MKRYCPHLFSYSRRRTHPIRIGSRLVLGGNAPVVVQSMTTANTADVEASAAQVLRIAEAGAELVRLTAPGRTEAERLLTIRRRIEERECYVPLVADVHFNPQVALIAAQYVSKVRINPGNFIDKRATFRQLDYTDAEYAAELERLRVQLTALIEVCKYYNTVIRIGVNHGSLSDRIMSRYGDTTDGMVESAMEFLYVCRAEGYDRVVISMKSSNTRVMVEAYRKLAARMDEEGMTYPLHLGVTEAGEGEDGRVRSAVGIGALLADGIGDTIRVSLTEAPENEMAPARILADYFVGREMHNYIPVDDEPVPYDPYTYVRRATTPVCYRGVTIGGGAPPIVVGDRVGEGCADLSPEDFALVTPRQAMQGLDHGQGWIACTLEHLSYEFLEWLESHPERILVLVSENSHWVGEIRACFVQLMRHGLRNPVIMSRCYGQRDLERLQLYAAADFGALLIDGFGDGIWIVNEVFATEYDEDSAGNLVETERDVTPDFDLTSLSFSILQAARARISKTEIISCPGCGRTLFELQEVARAVKARFGHYPGLKIAVMGCIVNGPGEMADADFGYVGAGNGVVTLYRGKEVVERNIPQEVALERLEALINQSLRNQS